MRWLHKARPRTAPHPIDDASVPTRALAAYVDTESLRNIVHNDLIDLIPRPYDESKLIDNVATFVKGPITLVDLDVPPTAEMSGLWNPTTRQLFLSRHYEGTPRVYALCHELTHIIRKHKATIGSRSEMFVAMSDATTAADNADVLHHFVGMMFNDGSLARCRDFGSHDEFEAEYMGTVMARLVLNPPPSQEVSYIRKALR